MSYDTQIHFGGYVLETNTWVITALAVAGLLYFVPTVIAMARRHTQRMAIFVLNLFLGWTFIGWVGALVWSVMAFTRPISNEMLDG